MNTRFLGTLTAVFLTFFISLPTLAAVQGQFVQKDNLFPRVEFATSEGKIVVELDRSRAPITVNNFLTYVQDGSYKGSVFHRVERDEENDRDFVIQGGGYDKNYDGLHENDPIFNESGSGLENDMYTIAMAYQDRKPHSATRAPIKLSGSRPRRAMPSASARMWVLPTSQQSMPALRR